MLTDIGCTHMLGQKSQSLIFQVLTLNKEFICVLVQQKKQTKKRISPPYFSVEPWLTMAEVQSFLSVFTRFVTLVHSSIQIFWRAVMFWGCWWAALTCNSLHRFSVGLRSRHWSYHSRTLKCYLCSHSFVALVICLGPLSCWEIQSCFILKTFTDRRFLLKMSLYIFLFILSLMKIRDPVRFCIQTAPNHDAIQWVWCSWGATQHLSSSKHNECHQNRGVLSDHMKFFQYSSR